MKYPEYLKFNGQWFARDEMERMLARDWPHVSFDEVVRANLEAAIRDQSKPTDVRSACERMDRIHSEFERREQLGLRPPSLQDVDRLFGRQE